MKKIFLLLLILNTGYSADYIGYDQFVDEVKEGNLIELKFHDLSEITGTLNANGKEKEFISFLPVRPVDDVLLLEILKEKGIDFKVSEKPEREPTIAGELGNFLFFKFPWVISILSLFLLFKANRKLNKLLKKKCEPVGVSND